MIDRRTLGCLATVVLSLGCGSSTEDREATLDLVSGLPLAEVWTETRSVGMGSPRSRRHLVSGWSENLWDRQRKVNYLLADDARAVLRFTVLSPRKLGLWLYGRPRDPESVEGDTIEVSVNGARVAQWQVQPHNKRYRARIDGGLLTRGENELALQYRSAARETSDSSQGKAGSRSMMWFNLDLALRDESEPPEPVVVDEGASILIPWGTRVEYTLRLPSASRLGIEKVGFVGNTAGALEIDLQFDGEETKRAATIDTRSEAVELSLDVDSESIARMIFAAVEHETVTSANSGVLVSGARVSYASEASPGMESSSERRGRRSEVEERNVLLYVIDTLRADHVGTYGYNRPVSPNMDRFASDATVFDNAIAQSSWTRSSMASVFTGLWPVKHDTNGRKDKLAEEALTLAEILSDAGMETSAIVRNWNIFPTFGFAQGFDLYRALKRGDSDQVNESFRLWSRYRDTERPFFLYLHTVDPHGPYRPPERFKQKFVAAEDESLDLDKHPGQRRTRAMSEAEKQRVVRHLKNLYDGEIAANDETFGQLLEDLAAQDLMDTTLIVVVSDHGEEFLEHGTWEHGKNLFAETLDVPLIIRFPNRGQGARIEQVVQHIDIMPTILDWLGLPIPAAVEGRSLLPLVESPATSSVSGSRLAFSYLELDGLPTRSVIDGRWKFIERLRGDQIIWSGLFDRESDPGERRNLLDEFPIRSRYMSMLLAARVQEGSVLTTSEAVLDAETEGALRALGYLD